MNCLSRDEIHPHLQRNPNSPISVMKKQNKANERNTTMKKFFAILLAFVMVCALCVTAFAASADLTGHTYTAYQIFTGTQADDSAELTEVEWADGIDAAAFLAALKASDKFGTPNAFAECTTASEVAAVMSDWEDNSAEAKAFAAIAYDYTQGNGIAVENGTTSLDAGYYLVVDVTPDGEDVYNLALLQMVKKDNFEIATKVDVPEVTKKVSDASALICTETAANHVHGKACYTWSDANKVAIGDTVLFSISSAVPAAAADYDYYYFIIGDTLANGLTYTTGSIAVTIGDASAVEGSDYSVKFGADGKTFELALHDAKTNAGKTVDVLYAATLNENAVIGITGNRNEVSVTFSSNPNFKYNGTKNPTTPYTPEDGAPEDSEKPGFPAPQDPGSTTDIPTGETPKDITLTFSTELKLYKVDQDLKPLTGAEFTLTGDALNVVLVSKDVYTADANGEYWKLTDGTYTKTAPVAADYMEPAAAGADKGYVVAENGYNGDVVVVDGVTYRPYAPATDAGKDVFVLVENNVAEYDSVSTKYAKSTELVEKTTAANDKVVATVDENGVIIFTGLNAGTYTLEETKTPKGYNSIDTIEFKISCDLPDAVVTGEEACEWSVESESDIAYNEAENAFEITVVNQKGSILPETGGIGNTIFYVLGGLLAAGAIILLVVKKRMSVEG